jgi:hypothetical protein
MPYEKIVLADGTEVLFEVPQDREATGKNDADSHQRDTTGLSVPTHAGETDKEGSQVSLP